LEDAVADRLWVDDECTRAFVANILTAFPDAPLPYPEEVAAEMEDLISPRYRDEGARELIHAHTAEFVQHHLQHAGVEGIRNVVKLLTVAAGYREARSLAAAHLDEVPDQSRRPPARNENWLHSPLRGVVCVVSCVVVAGSGFKTSRRLGLPRSC
jgi:hypothetical protein